MSGVLLEAVSYLADWRRIRTFKCLAIVEQPESHSAFDVHAEPNNGSYLCVERGSGRRFSYDDRTRHRLTGGLEDPYFSNQYNWEALPARLSFPMSLGIWGRRGDAYRMVDAFEDGGRITVELRSATEPHRQGMLTIDPDRRMAVRLDTPGLSLAYKNIEPSPTIFGVES